MSVLCMINGPLSGHSFEIDQEETFLGRAPDNHIQIVDQSVSRTHAKISKRDDRYFIEDLESQKAELSSEYRRYLDLRRRFELGKGADG